MLIDNSTESKNYSDMKDASKESTENTYNIRERDRHKHVPNKK